MNKESPPTTTESVQVFVDALPEHVALLDANGVVLAVNSAWQRFAVENGLAAKGSSRTCVGIDYPALCDSSLGSGAEGAAEAAAGIRSVLNRRQVVFAQAYSCHSPDRQRWFRMTVLPLNLNEVAAVVIHADITVQTLEEMARRDSEMRLQMALDATGDGIWDWHPLSGQVYLSPGYYAMTGYRPEDEPGSFDFFRRIVHPDDWAHVLETMDAHLRGETPVSEIEYRIHTASGEIRWISGRGRVVQRNAAGAAERMLGLVTDITAVKRIEQAMRESEMRFRTVVEDQTEIISRFAADGTVMFANEVFFRIFDKKPDEVIGCKWHPNAHPEDLAMIEARLAELAPDNPVVTIENRVFSANGALRWMQFVNRGRFDTDGCLSEIQAVGRDITERHVLEEQQRQLLEENQRLGGELIRLQEVERAALAKEMHDELSQQLVAIRAHAGAIVRRKGNVRDKTHIDAQAIGDAAGSIYEISHRLMEGLYPQALDSAGLIAAIAGMMAHWGKARPDVKMWLRAAPIEPIDPDVRVNLFRVVQECLVNALAHGHARSIRIFVGERRKGKQRRVRIVVRDDGVGMVSTPSRSGYGLVIMRERARILGGHLALSSEPGRGLRVAVDVPLAT